MDHDASSEAGELRYHYKVEKVINSVAPYIGSFLTEVDLEFYCKDEDWEVVIT